MAPRRDAALSLKRPPGPKGSLLSGHNREFKADRLGFLQGLSRTYGPVASFRLFHHRIHLLTDPELIQQVLVTDAGNYIKHFGARAYKPLLGEGLVTSEGIVWRRQRRLIQPAFHKAAVACYAPAMTEQTHRMLATWSDGRSVNVHEEFTRLASRIALRTLFDLDDAGNSDRFTQPLRVAIDLINKRLRSLVKLPLWCPTPSNIRLRRVIRELTGQVEGYIAAGRARQSPGQDLLSRLIVASDHDSSAMDDRQLRDEAMTMYISSHETTALALTWTWYLLAKHPAVEARVAAELRDVLAGRDATADDVRLLPYLSAVISEALRLYPPVHLIGRQALCDTTVGDFAISRGSTMLMSAWVSQRDSRFFSGPDTFDPQRWLDGLAHHLPRYAYFPFSGGPRMCIGSSFALTETAVVMATVMQRYIPTVDQTVPITVNPQITLQPSSGVPAVLRRRT